MTARPIILLAALAMTPIALVAQHVIGARDAMALRADSVFQRFDRTDSPGCALGVYENNRIRYARGYGMASLEHGIALSPRSVLDIGSISKQFTAMATLLLQQEGKLNIDDPIRKYIPELPPYADGVTIRRALSQTSGLRDLYVLHAQTGRTIAGDTLDALRLITRSAETNYAPGARYLYTNSGWVLVAQAIYRLTGKSLAQFAEERIFGPLGMRETRYQADVSAIRVHGAEGYAPRPGGGFRVNRSTYDGAIVGAGAVHTTIEDFGRWLANYDDATIGGHEVLALMTTPTRLTDGSPATSGVGTAYAIGLNSGTMRGLRTISHGGSWAGYRAHFIRFPDQRMAVAVFCNLTTSGPDSLARKVAGIYLGDRMQPDSAAMWTVALQGAARATPPAGTVRSHTGVWRHVERGEVRRTRLSGDTLYLVGDETATLVPIEGGRFRTAGNAEVRIGERELTVRTTGDVATYTRADTVALTAAQLGEYAGDYRSEEVEATHTWRVERGQLVAYANNRRQGVLEPAYRDGFVRGGTVIDVQRDARGRITGFLVEAGRVRHLRFTRVP